MKSIILCSICLIALSCVTADQDNRQKESHWLTLKWPSNWQGFVKKKANLKNTSFIHGIRVDTTAKKTSSSSGMGQPGKLSSGKDLYSQYCLGCHGKNGEGDGPIAHELQKKPANLQKLAENMIWESFFLKVSEGKGEMPAWKELLNKQEIKDLAAYLKTLKNSG